MKWLVVIACIISVLIFYSMCVVAGKCDEKSGYK
jgi:hypothetical protein